MPVWHETTKDLYADGAIEVLGIIQEQHPDRARLFMQWHQMDWPLLVDALNLLEVQAVPSHILIDEAGVVHDVVRARGPEDMRRIVEEFINQPTVEIGRLPTKSEQPDLEALAAQTLQGDADDAIRFADALTMWGEESDYDAAIDHYERALSSREDDGELHFHLGVAYRKRFDSDARQPGDFAKAIEHWKLAREVDPNQYIWRRRIQQYGPRLDKPYSFYDWVHEAREEIIARGETPAPLSVEPGGAEFAYPSRQFESADTPAGSGPAPDPDARITPDERGFINVEVVHVPHTDPRNPHAARIHVLMTPNESLKAHWNNEAEPMTMWLTSPEGWQVDQQRIIWPNPTDAAATSETRRLEFELNPPADVQAGTYTINTYALYNVCEDVDGICLYRRQNIPIEIVIE